MDFKDGVQDEYAFHLLVSGIRGVRPGRYQRRTEVLAPEVTLIRDKLFIIRTWQEERLLDPEPAKDGQRRLLDKLIDLKGK